MARNTAQLNAISREYTRRGQAKAREELMDRYTIDFDDYAKATGYKGSPVLLLTNLDKRVKGTCEKVVDYILNYRWQATEMKEV